MRSRLRTLFAALRALLLGTLRRQLVLGVALVHALLMAGFVWDVTRREQDRHAEHLVEEVRSLATTLAASSSGWLLARDIAGLHELLAAQAQYPDVAYAMVTDAQGTVLAHTDRAREGQRVQNLPAAGSVARGQPVLLARAAQRADMVAPVWLGGRTIGWAGVGLAAGERIGAEEARTWRDGALYALAAIALGSLLAAWMAGRITRRLAVVRDAAEAVERGATLHRATLRGTDEAAHVAHALNRMLDSQAQAAGALADSEQRLRIALDAADMRAWRWDIGADATDWGDDPQRLLGPRPPQGYPDFRQMVVPEDREAFLAAGRAVMAGGSDYSVEFRLRRTDDEVRWLVTRGRVVRDAQGGALYMIGVTQDITERKRAEQQLRQSEARANLIIDNSPDALLIVDVDGVVLRVNDRVEPMFGYAPHELLGRNIDELVPQAMRAVHPARRNSFFDHPPAHGTARLTNVHGQRKDGSLVPVQISLALMGVGPQRQVIALVRDETQERTLQADLARYRDHLEELVLSRTAELVAARNESERLARVKSEFLANMSHEIRTPLNAVLGLAQIGAFGGGGNSDHSGNAGVSTAAREAFAGIQEAGHHLLGVINDILDFSRIDAGKLVIEQQPFALASALANATSFVKGAAQQKGLGFEMSVADDLPRWVVGDAQRLQQILVNLLANAVKFTPEGSVCLRVARDPTCPGHDIFFKVIDEGIGMTAAEIERLFVPFEQADASTTRRFGGSGLGLAISDNLARLMGGDISVDSAPGKGSAFVLRLPLPASATEPAPPTAAGLRAAAQGPRLAGLRVLAAEDVEVNRLVLEALLAHEGAQVVFAHNGQQAVQRVRQDGAGAYDVLLMDVQMPLMDGYEATRRVHEIAPDLPVIGLTAHAMTEEREKCLAAGMRAHVSKPVDMTTLVAAIRLCTGRPGGVA